MQVVLGGENMLSSLSYPYLHPMAEKNQRVILITEALAE